MDSARHNTPLRLVFIVALLVLVVLAQTAAAAIAPTGSSAETGRLIGRAGFAYLSGIRTFAAAVLWNRLEPQFHLYYANKPLKENTQLLPTIRLVQALDPQFVQAYYNAAWIVWERGRTEEAFDIAQQGIDNNPRAGLLRASLAQLLLSEDSKTKSEAHLDEAVAQADAGMAADMVWTNDADKFEGYAVFAGRVPRRRTHRQGRGRESRARTASESQQAVRASVGQVMTTTETVRPTTRGHMSLLQPDLYYRSVTDIDPDALRQRGIRMVLLDLDNTLVPRNTTQAAPEVREWLQTAKDSGLLVTIVSNNWHERVQKAADSLGVPILGKATKPFPSAFRKALEHADETPRTAAVVGDQIFTDILGGNLLGALTVLVVPLAGGSDLPHTRVLRGLERLVLRNRSPNGNGSGRSGGE